MTPKEAAKVIFGVLHDDCFSWTPEVVDAFILAISALEKQEQTKEAIPHRNYQRLSDYWCECGWHLGKYNDVKFCADCGRKINWEKRKYKYTEEEA